MKQRTLIYILCLFTLSTSWAQSDDDLVHVSEKITAPYDNDSLKVAAIYFWITRNIAYDNGFSNRIEGDTTLWQEPYTVVKTKKAVCIGYAKLFRELCKMNNIKAYVVEGLVKNKEGRVEREGHAWNVVKVAQHYYLLDATWGATDGPSAQMYFLTGPSPQVSGISLHSTVFSESHCPYDPVWQLMTQPIGYQCFTENKNCNASDNIFAFKDTIQKWEALDSLEQAFNEANRKLNYNPNNLQAIRAIASFYSQKAIEGITQYNQLKTEIKEKKRKAVQKKQVLKLLDDTKAYAETAKSYYERITAFSQKKEYTDADINLDLIKENLLNLEKERRFVETYFKD
jgi:Transglutaminase-like superfamily